MFLTLNVFTVKHAETRQNRKSAIMS